VAERLSDLLSPAVGIVVREVVSLPVARAALARRQNGTAGGRLEGKLAAAH
jgi:hypothetical protein